MTIVWSAEALNDLVALRAYLSSRNPVAAIRMVLEVVQSIESILPDHPNAGRPGRVTGTRELVVAGTPYIVPYRVKAASIEVLRVYHGARRWPDQV